MMYPFFYALLLNQEQSYIRFGTIYEFIEKMIAMKRMLLFLFLVVPVLPAVAQKNKKSPFILNPQKETQASNFKFSGGVRAGIVVNKLSTNLGDYVTHNYVGFKGGLFAKFNIKKWYIQPEVSFAMNGGNIHYREQNTHYVIRVNTIEVPVLAGYDLISSEFFKLRLNAGPYVAFNVSQKITGDAPYRDEDLLKVNAGLMAGAGLDIWKIGLDFRYQFGLTNMLKSHQAFQEPLQSVQNGVFDISLSYRF